MSIILIFLITKNDRGDTASKIKGDILVVQDTEGIKEKAGVESDFTFYINWGFNDRVVFANLIGDRLNNEAAGFLRLARNRATNSASKEGGKLGNTDKFVTIKFKINVVIFWN